MPELPDLTLYLDAIERRTLGRTLLHVEIVSPFVLRSVDPPIAAAHGRRLTALSPLGKRLVLGLEGELFLVIHLMIAGRLHWHEQAPRLNRRRTLAAFDFDSGTLSLTEAGTTRRASIHLVKGKSALTEFDRGGLEVMDSTLREFAARLRLENHTVRRALADPRLFSGIGNAYSDEILHRAKLSPLLLTQKLSDEQARRLHAAVQSVLREWTKRLREEAGEAFPEKVTAFREGFAIHGRFRLPCPVCGTSVQRIRYAENETNYCPTCQTGGKLLADRALSRLLRADWPRSLEEMDEKVRKVREVRG